MTAWMTASLAFLPERPDLPPFAIAIFILMVASFGLVGALVATRQPRNPIGWILWSTALIVAFAVVGDAYTRYSVEAFDGTLPGTIMIAWLAAAGLIPAFATVVVFVPLLFPDGRLLSPRWRWVAGFAIVAIVAGPVLTAFQPGPLPSVPTSPNPFGIQALEGLSAIIELANGPGIIIALFLAIASSVLRYRRRSQIEREQLKWFGAAVGVTGIGFVLAITGLSLIGDVGWVIGILGLSLIPVAIGIAILRYRLYDIDVIIHRALVYVPLTAIIAGIYTASVALSQRVLAATGQKSDVAIVLTTLVVVVVFTPLKNAVQATVDRRFKEAPRPPEQLPGPSDDPAELLRKLAELRDAGIITNVEFKAKKRDILDRL
jgi:hypothetical protein